MSLILLAKGFALGISMILPLGSQNAMMLNQGINRNHHLLTASFFALSDILLITFGVMGGSFLLASNEIMFDLLTWGGILFLCSYAAMSVKAAFSGTTDSASGRSAKKSLKIVLISSFLVTFLNPHVYIDMLMIIGSVGGQYQGSNKIYFMLGLMSASVFWFFTLAIGAAKLSKQLSKPHIKGAIDITVAIIMFAIAWSLLTTWLAG
ncbi:amino acid transporter [Psychromonas sp. MB-3u-54]|uniref:LysE/ArgO family amino acid transporter n=1 Tax=Psychromonas sp. MB-3u-54 TaxID=2058319 RepID=UPI000C3344FC|nr:LysE/ArgO family amino acid transporter [Psychromonas sp. MB-3u-54]PKH02930.1 amino acid transporter [Psychromonas sp. MB-3u-54]